MVPDPQYRSADVSTTNGAKLALAWNGTDSTVDSVFTSSAWFGFGSRPSCSYLVRNLLAGRPSRVSGAWSILERRLRRPPLPRGVGSSGGKHNGGSAQVRDRMALARARARYLGSFSYPQGRVGRDKHIPRSHSHSLQGSQQPPGWTASWEPPNPGAERAGPRARTGADPGVSRSSPGHEQRLEAGEIRRADRRRARCWRPGRKRRV